MKAPEGELSAAVLDALRPPPRRTVSQWADQEAIVTEGPEKGGRYRSSRTPYVVEVMDAFNAPEVESVVFMAASQTAKTACIKNVLGYFASDDPSPILLVRETDKEVGAFSQERVDPFFRETPILRGRLGEGQRNARNKTFYREFPGGFVAFASAGSIASLSSRAIRIVLFDEVDRYRQHINTGENPLKQGVQRAKTFRGRRKIGYFSTPGLEGMSETAELYAASDQRQYHVPCPHCGALFVMLWEHVQYRTDDGQPDPAHAWLKCPQCAGRIEEGHRHHMVAAGQWIPRYPERKANRGYQLSALYSPWTTFAELAEEWVRVTRARDSLGIVDFYGLQLGLPAPAPGTAVHMEALERHRERYAAEVPAGVLLLTCQVDTQDFRLEGEVTGWGIGKERWGIRRFVFPGDTSQRGPWARLDELLARKWETEDGRELAIRCTVVDAGGHRTDEVRDFCGKRGHRNVWAIMGRGGAGRPIVTEPSERNRSHVPTYYVGTDNAKNAVLTALMIDKPGPGYWHWPDDIATGYDRDYFDGLLSERRVAVQHAGRTRIRWVQVKHRNEPFDLAQYSLAAVGILRPEFEVLAKRQADRAAARARRERAVARAQSRPAQDAPAPAAPLPLPPARVAPSARPRGPRRPVCRRVLSRGIV